MVERLLETMQLPRRSTRIDQRVRDRLVKDGLVHVVRAGKRRENSSVREQLERSDVQFVVAAQRVA